MHFGPSNPTWAKLYGALASLAGVCRGEFAFVLDVGNGLWCVGLPDTRPTTDTAHEDRAADRFYANEVVPRAATMRRGARIELEKVEGDDRYVALSFAAIYFLVVWFEDAFEPAIARRRIRRALPEIERLTLALPAPGGPGADEGEAKERA